ncbi:MAG: hypothetical protein ACRD82_11920 [Blastocatellia bacterium]
MDPNTSITSDSLGEDQSARKTYQSPELVLYGNISEITKTVDMMGAADGGMGMTNKT